MVDIHSATAEIRRGKTERKFEEEEERNHMAKIYHRAAILNRDVCVIQPVI